MNNKDLFDLIWFEDPVGAKNGHFPLPFFISSSLTYIYYNSKQIRCICNMGNVDPVEVDHVIKIGIYIKQGRQLFQNIYM